MKEKFDCEKYLAYCKDEGLDAADEASLKAYNDSIAHKANEDERKALVERQKAAYEAIAAYAGVDSAYDEQDYEFLHAAFVSIIGAVEVTRAKITERKAMRELLEKLGLKESEDDNEA